MLTFKTARALGIFSFVSVAATTVAKPVAKPVATPARSSGVTYEVVMTTTSQPAGPAGAGYSMTARGMTDAKGSSRMEIVSVDGAAGGAFTVGDYYLSVDGKSTLVHVATKTYVDVLDQAANALKNMPPEIAAQLTLTDVTGKVEKVSGDEAIAGLSAEHHRVSLSYSMNVMGQSIPSTVVSDYWFAKLPVKFAIPIGGGPTKAPTVAGPMAGLAARQFELMPSLPDRTVIKSTSSTTLAIMGQNVVTSITTEMKNIKEANVDAALFVIPDGFTKVEK